MWSARLEKMASLRSQFLSNFRFVYRSYSTPHNGWQAGNNKRKWNNLVLSMSTLGLFGGAAMWLSYRERQHHLFATSVHALSLDLPRNKVKTIFY
jgi:hypothetical protein